MPKEESDVAVELAIKTNPGGSVLPMKAPAKQVVPELKLGRCLEWLCYFRRNEKERAKGYALVEKWYYLLSPGVICKTY